MWFRSRFGSPAQGTPRRRYKPRLEALEDRTLLATVTWVGGSGDWDNAANWRDDQMVNRLPTSADDAVIDVSGITVTHASGKDAVGSLTVNDPFTLSGGSLTVLRQLQVQNNNTFTLSGGVLVSATLAVGSTLTCAPAGQAILDQVTIDGLLDLAANNDAAVNVTDGLTVNGQVQLGSADGSTYGILAFSSTETLSGTGSVLFGGSPINTINVANGQTLTIGAGITIDGQNGSVGLTAFEGGGGSMTNLGTIAAADAGQPAGSTTPGTLNILGAGLRNTGTLAASNDATLAIFPNDNAVWSNAGTLSVDDATLDLGGDFTPADVAGLVRNGGTVNVVGTFNDGTSGLTLNDATGSWILQGGEIDGGTITTTGNAALEIGSSFVSVPTLNGVTLDGVLDLATQTARTVNVIGGMILNGTIELGGADGSTYGTLRFGATETLSGTGRVLFGGSSINTVTVANGQTLSIGAGITIDGQNGSVGLNAFNGGGGSLVNQGTIAADDAGQPAGSTPPGTLVILGSGLINSGTLAASNGATLSVFLAAGQGFTGEANVPWSNTGTLSVDHATLDLGGLFTPADVSGLVRNGGTVNLIGVLNNVAPGLLLDADTGSWNLQGGVINGGTIATADGAVLLAAPAGYGPSTLNDVTLDGVLDQAATTATTVTVTGDLTLNGTVELGSADGSTFGTLLFSTTETLDGTGRVLLGASPINAIDVANGQTLTIGAGVTVDGQSGSVGLTAVQGGGGTLNNLGTIAANGGGTITVTGALNYSAGTLTGGTWQAAGDSTLVLPAAAITNLAAAVVLDGPAPGCSAPTTHSRWRVSLRSPPRAACRCATGPDSRPPVTLSPRAASWSARPAPSPSAAAPSRDWAITRKPRARPRSTER